MHVLKLLIGYATVVVTGAVVVAALAEKKEMESRNAVLTEQALSIRKPDYPIDESFIRRWSSYAFKPVKIDKSELNSLFEAARWAPSSYNEQPWRFIYAERETEHWQSMFDLLVPFNQLWAQNASVLVLVLGRKNFSHNNEYSPTHAFDCGAAWQNMALQACHMGLVTHGIGGFDAERARKTYNVPADYEVISMIVIGKPGDPALLPQELKESQKPSTRKAVNEFVSEGSFVF